MFRTNPQRWELIYPTLYRDLQGLKGETKGPWKGDSKQLATWAPGLVDAIALALRKWPQYKVYRVTPLIGKNTWRTITFPIVVTALCVCTGLGWAGGMPEWRTQMILYVSRRSRANSHSWSRSRKQKPQTRHFQVLPLRLVPFP